MKEFKCRCSKLGTLLQISSLTEKQLETVSDLLTKKTPLTKTQSETLKELQFRHENPDLLAGAKTLLNEWYAYQIGLDKDTQFVEEIQKGIVMEDTGIELFDEFLLGGVGLLKNTEKKSNSFIEGTCDINYNDFTADIKLPWDSKTFYTKMTKPIDKDYIWQGKGYSILYNKPKVYLAYILVDTPSWSYLQASFRGIKPEFIAFDSTYSHIELKDRIYIVEIPVLESDQKEIEAGVKMARDYLKKIDSDIKARLGVVNQL